MKYEANKKSLQLEAVKGHMKKIYSRDLPGGPVLMTLPSNAGGAGSILGRGAKIPHASQPKNQKS